MVLVLLFEELGALLVAEVVVVEVAVGAGPVD